MNKLEGALKEIKEGKVIKTLTDVIKFVNEYWNRYSFIKWGETPVGEEFIGGLAKMGDMTYYFSDGTLTSSGDF